MWMEVWRVKNEVEEEEEGVSAQIGRWPDNGCDHPDSNDLWIISRSVLSEVI